MSTDFNYIDNMITGYINEVAYDNYNIEYERVESTINGKSIMQIQYYVDEIYKRIYLYLLVDQDFRFGKRIKHSEEFYNKIINKFISKYKLSTSYKIYCLGPAFNTKGSTHQFGIVHKNIITPHTVTYWEGLDGTYEFIDDSELFTIFVNKKILSTPEYKTDKSFINNYVYDVEKINKKYNYNISSNIIAGFSELQTLYLTYFGAEINPINNTNIHKLYLFNKTAYIEDLYKNYNEDE